MIIRSLTVGPLEENCWLVIDQKTHEAVLVDPGEEPERLLAAVDAEGATLKAVWLTHAHFDHLGAVARIVRERNVPVWLHPLDRGLYDLAAQSAAQWGVSIEQPPPPTHELAEGGTVTLGSHVFHVIHIPGHSPGHVGFLGHDVLLGGDCVFAGSVGRTDLPFCDPVIFQDTLQRLAALPPSTRVLPGHGPATTIARERASNPYLRPYAAN